MNKAILIQALLVVVSKCIGSLIGGFKPSAEKIKAQLSAAFQGVEK